LRDTDTPGGWPISSTAATAMSSVVVSDGSRPHHDHIGRRGGVGSCPARVRGRMRCARRRRVLEKGPAPVGNSTRVRVLAVRSIQAAPSEPDCRSSRA
jgi:hypothetical protein